MKPLALLLLTASLTLLTPPLFAADLPPSAESAGTEDPALERARKIVADAERLFDAGHFQAALAEYTQAYEVLAGHPRQYFVLYNLAACNERLFRYDVALELYDEYLRRAPETEQDRAQVAAIMRTLRALLGTLVVDSAIPATIWVDDRQLGVAPGRWLLPAGRHVIEARAELYESIRQEVQLGSGQLVTLRFAPSRLSTNTGPRPGYFWTAAALTGLSTVAGTTFGVMALSARKSGEERADYYLDSQTEAERTRNYALAADIGFGSAVLFGVSATVLYFITDWSPSREKSTVGRPAPPRPPSGLMVGGPGGAGATWRMVF